MRLRAGCCGARARWEAVFTAAAFVAAAFVAAAFVAAAFVAVAFAAVALGDRATRAAGLTAGPAASTGARKRPVWLAGTAATCSGVPSAMTRPPPDPPSGPMSMTQSALLMTSRLCSMTITVLPLSTRPCSTPSSLRMSSKCSPVVGSSST